MPLNFFELRHAGNIGKYPLLARILIEISCISSRIVCSMADDWRSGGQLVLYAHTVQPEKFRAALAAWRQERDACFIQPRSELPARKAGRDCRYHHPIDLERATWVQPRQTKDRIRKTASPGFAIISWPADAGRPVLEHVSCLRVAAQRQMRIS